MPLYCNENAALEACAKAKGWPDGPKIYSGDSPPEESQIGYWAGDIFLNTDTSVAYIFNGEPGTAIGWNALNP